MQISGTLTIGEANATAGTLAAKQRGSSLYYWAALIGLGLVGAVLGGWLIPRALPLDPGAGGALGWVAGALLYLFVARPLTVRIIRGRLMRRGVPRDLPLSLTLDDDVLHYDIGDVGHVAKWRAVSELFRSKGYWIFLVQGSAWFAPQRFFATSAEERAFVAAALAHMSEEARVRSLDAGLFARTVPNLA